MSGLPGAAELTRLAAGVKFLVLDVDGVLSDGGLYYGPQGEALKRFDVKDGHALVMARHAGLPFAFLSGRTSPITEVRARELGAVAVLQGCREKLPALTALLAEQGVSAEACAYMGDDLIDLPALRHVGLPACPADAVAEVRQHCRFVAKSPGGRGAVRELVELCLRASGGWPEVASNG